MADPPAVAVVVPLFDQAAAIDRCLRSVLAQERGDWELVVVDDGSTDAGAARVERYAGDGRIRLLRQANAGPGGARNRGLAATRAPLVAFLDADDEWQPEFLAVALAHLQARPTAAAVATSVWHGTGGPDRSIGFRRSGLRSGPWRCPPDLPARTFKSYVELLHSSAVVVRREAVTALGGFYERDRCDYGEDAWLWARLLLREEVVLLLEPHVRFHDDHGTLGARRPTPYPEPPLVRHAWRVVREAPGPTREAARRFLAWYTLNCAERAVRQGQLREAAAMLLRPQLLHAPRRHQLGVWRRLLLARLRRPGRT